MESEHIRYERSGPTAKIIIDRPEARNAMTSAMRRDMQSLFEELAGDRDVRVVLLRGAGGKSFASGADIAEFMEHPGAKDIIALAAQDELLYEAIENCPAPVVAVIDGYAFGGGLALAAACDLRICTTDSKFGITSAKSLGNCNSPGIYARLVALAGPARTKEMLICASVLSAEQAATWGLVTEVVERDLLESRLQELAEQLSGHAPLTMWAAKEATRRLTAGFSTDEDIMEKVFSSHDFREGIAAFVEKRAPEWRNE